MTCSKNFNVHFNLLVDAVKDAEDTLHDTLFSIKNQNVSQLIAQASHILNQIKQRDFTQADHQVTKELRSAKRGMYGPI